MVKRILTTCFILFVQSADAGWVDVNESEDAHVFVDSEIKTQGDIVKIWEYEDYKKPKKGNMSARFLLELDCKNELYHPLYLSAFKGSNMTGEVTEVDLSKKTTWAKIPNKDIDVLATYLFGCSQKEIPKNIQEIGKSADMSFAIDMNSIIKSGNISTFVEYNNFAKPYFEGTNASSLSATNRKEIDCNKHTTKTNYVTFYSGPNATGDVNLFRIMNIPSEPVDLSKNTLANYEFDVACPK